MVGATKLTAVHNATLVPRLCCSPQQAMWPQMGGILGPGASSVGLWVRGSIGLRVLMPESACAVRGSV